MPHNFSARPVSANRAEHAEGPMWDARRQEVLWVDIPNGHVHRSSVNPDGTLTLLGTHDIGQQVGAVVPNTEGGWLLATEFGFGTLSETGELHVLAEPELGRRPETRMNDGKCDPLGRMWAGSMSYSETPGAGKLYLLDSMSTEPRVSIGSVTISNGMAWTPDGRTMYYIDTPTHRIDRVQLSADGVIESREPAIRIDPDLGSPDGMTIDDEGCLWVALWNGAAVHRYSPDGELLARVEVQASQVSSVAFGGPSMSTLFITTSQENFSDAQRAAEPEAGYVHAVETGVSGRPADAFRG
ncbi:SMP-30/gluconolactonase/LRE family protein [Saxibacter everestensis]|uniref:SMP-30/gluconolactonase/LRE family protein n=1 Tax=Saxibacter everestensis TaxID=2909229 RepID=A0ABY8QV64_9MICO|nr:SMP-30/gluconolactonase/LRE family protein [Brevibacteriaceae bacterium ZFBP1038]